eukprot:CAMPEP_0183311362 /NCGR_PEP_ID=MMETSP0160_2-20130417/36507_1 /TAXON_ID=2839 ORGANISM="Odontella Sinensis, Strain Grunow 1884" /NCGR_SAMPLE_ID=MMETSP0160_2 /ASSEMBLY_ACC=CAM_ASM_000250 /LENGTH=245 /DNA_ID=CAMNT_0025475909 /DNA_START=121 /DNA_END=858 /DNA_ORIENTATION=+
MARSPRSRRSPATGFALLAVLLLACALLLPTSVLAGMNAESAAFLAENAKKPGVVTLPSGLQYKVLRQGGGSDHPTVDSPCSCHYKGTLIDGTQFDSSYDRGSPTTFAPNQVIKGWTEAMQLMVEGDKWEMYIPSDLGYGDRGSPPKIKGGDALIFTMEILEIQGNKVPASKCNPSTLEDCDDKEKVYIGKVKGKFGGDVDEMQVERDRILKVSASVKKEELLGWAKRRVKILERLIAAESEEEL